MPVEMKICFFRFAHVLKKEKKRLKCLLGTKDEKKKFEGFKRDLKRDFKRNLKRDFKRDLKRDFKRDFKRDLKRDFKREFKRDCLPAYIFQTVFLRFSAISVARRQTTASARLPVNP